MGPSPLNGAYARAAHEHHLMMADARRAASANDRAASHDAALPLRRPRLVPRVAGLARRALRPRHA